MAALLAEMDRFYGSASADPPDERLRQINEALFASPPAAHALLAWEGAELVGFAAYSFLWPAIGLTRSLYLKELYVAARSQRQGVGRRLMEALFEAGASSIRASGFEPTRTPSSILRCTRSISPSSRDLGGKPSTTAAHVPLSRVTVA
jgi:GNAT superfamily N-acetyltransferase